MKSSRCLTEGVYIYILIMRVARIRALFRHPILAKACRAYVLQVCICICMPRLWKVVSNEACDILELSNTPTGNPCRRNTHAYRQVRSYYVTRENEHESEEDSIRSRVYSTHSELKSTLTSPASRLAILAKACLERSMVLWHPSLLAHSSTILS